MSAYQSPIILTNEHAIPINQCVTLKGKNHGATFEPDNRLFRVHDRIILTVGNQRYQLVEYHFHVPAEHEVDGMTYPSELHYVFMELEADGSLKNHEGIDVCANIVPEEHGNILAVGRTIEPKKIPVDLSKLQVEFPCDYYEYDGSLTTPPFDPVKWIVGQHPIHLPQREIILIAKNARPLQPLNGRIILKAKASKS